MHPLLRDLSLEGELMLFHSPICTPPILQFNAANESNVPVPRGSPRSVATVNNQCAPSHETASITQSEERRTPELLRRSQPSEHILRFPHSPRSRVLLEDLLDHGGDNVAGAQVVNTDTMTAPFHSKRARELDHGCLGGVVDGRGHALVGDEAAHAGDEEDRALLLVVEHLAGGGGGRVEDAVVVDLHHFVQGGLRVLQGALEVVDAGGGNHAVQPLVVACNLGEDVFYFGLAADVNAAVFQQSAVVLFSMLFGSHELGVRALQSI